MMFCGEYPLENSIINHKITPKKLEERVPKEYKKIYKLINEEPINIEDIFHNLNMKNIAELNQKLSVMELEGYIEKLAGNNYIRKVN